MVKVDLPFEMSIKPTPYNSRIFKIEIDHPVLDMGDSYNELKSEVFRWLSVNCDGWSFSFDGKNYSLEFVKETDATMFILRWLSDINGYAV
jgi:hypothetical protein